MKNLFLTIMKIHRNASHFAESYGFPVASLQSIPGNDNFIMRHSLALRFQLKVSRGVARSTNLAGSVSPYLNRRG